MEGLITLPKFACSTDEKCCNIYFRLRVQISLTMSDELRINSKYGYVKVKQETSDESRQRHSK